MAAWEFEFYLRVLILVSLSNDNGDGNENVISKYMFALFYPLLDYFNLCDKGVVVPQK